MSTYLSLNVHVVFSTRNRSPMIAGDWRTDLHSYIGGTLRGLGASPLAVGGVPDHVHFLASLRATHAVADLVREVKKASTAWARDRYHQFAWQKGYGAFTIGHRDIPDVVAYIGAQERHHRKLSSEDELRALLVEFGISYDEEFFE